MNRIKLPTLGVTNPKTVIAMSSAGNYCWVYQVGKKPVLVSRSLQYIHQYLPHFVRANREWLINPHHITQQERNAADRVTGIYVRHQRYSVARRRREAVTAQLSTT